jgi:DNA polymerase
MRQIIKHIWDTHGAFNLALTNNARFHPMDNNGKDREPTKEEIERCLPILLSDIYNLNPITIMPVGKNAASTFLAIEGQTMTMIRGGTFTKTIGNRISRVIPTWHPSFLTRQYGTFKPEAKNKFDNEFIQDICKAMDW